MKIVNISRQIKINYTQDSDPHVNVYLHEYIHKYISIQIKTSAHMGGGGKTEMGRI